MAPTPAAFVPQVAAIAPDAIGFPEMILPALGLRCHLFPATKVQYEFYLGGTPGADTRSYTEMLTICPRTGWRTLTGWPTGVFAAGARPEDASQLVNWLGAEFRLPTAVEWQQIDAALTVSPPNALLSSIAGPQFHPVASALVTWARTTRRVGNWRALGLFEDGFLEWVVMSDRKPGLHGRPRAAFARGLLHNPQVHPPIRPLNDHRQPGIAFRLVRPLQPGDTP